MAIPVVTLNLDNEQRRVLIRVIKFWIDLNRHRPKEDTVRSLFFLDEVLKMLENRQK